MIKCEFQNCDKKCKNINGVSKHIKIHKISQKDYYDSYRKEGGLPPELQGKVEGKLVPDIELMDDWRNWRRGLSFFDPDLQATLGGAIDECLVDEDIYIPVDFKTRGSPPKEGQSELFYQTQLDTYSLLLQKNGYKIKDQDQRNESE